MEGSRYTSHTDTIVEQENAGLNSVVEGNHNVAYIGMGKELDAS